MNSSWRMAVTATLHCLTGCAIGEVLGMFLSTWWGWGTTPSVVLSVALAFFFGYLLTFVGVRRAGADPRTAARTAIASDTVSIATMEVVDNLFLIVVPGAMAATLSSGLFWWSLALSLAVAFVLTVPVNHWLIGRGKGHAVVHELHGHSGSHTDHTDHSGPEPASHPGHQPAQQSAHESAHRSAHQSDGHTVPRSEG